MVPVSAGLLKSYGLIGKNIHNASTLIKKRDLSASFVYKTTTVGTTQVEATDYLRLAPNPSADFVQVQHTQPFARITVCDILGTIVLDETFAPSQQRTITTAQLPQGCYIITASTADNKRLASQKFVKK